MHRLAYKKAKTYKRDLEKQKLIPGLYFARKLKSKDISQLAVEEFIELIVRTKKPCIFAESTVCGDGSDWTQAELSILGDICICVPVRVYDNGMHYQPEVYKNPFNAYLIYTPGALLRNGRGGTPADWEEITIEGKMNYKGYFHLYERRLLPGFIHANTIAGSNNKKALITIPGLGCGQFAGKFKGQLGAQLEKALIEFLDKHGKLFSNIKAVYYDPYRACNNQRYEINGITFFVRPLTQGNMDRPQLCKPKVYEEKNDDFSNCELFSIVAWDHVSWPGNDFYIGSRATDDGVKAAATNSMAVMTGIQGNYNVQTNTYRQNEECENWEAVVIKNKIQLDVKDNLLVY